MHTQDPIVQHYLQSDGSIGDTANALGISYSRAYRSISASSFVSFRLIQQRRSKAITEARANKPSPLRRLDAEEVALVRKALDAGEPQKTIAKRHSVEPSTISNIKTGRTYRDP